MHDLWWEKTIHLTLIWGTFSHEWPKTYNIGHAEKNMYNVGIFSGLALHSCLQNNCNTEPFIDFSTSRDNLGQNIEGIVMVVMKNINTNHLENTEVKVQPTGKKE